MKWCKFNWNWFLDYSTNSTIHGVKYVGERDRSYCEKIFWLIFIIISLLGCGYMISEMYEKWENEEISIVLTLKTRQVEDVPFPAVTICPINKWKTSRMYEPNLWSGTQQGGLGKHRFKRAYGIKEKNLKENKFKRSYEDYSSEDISNENETSNENDYDTNSSENGEEFYYEGNGNATNLNDTTNENYYDSNSSENGEEYYYERSSNATDLNENIQNEDISNKYDTEYRKNIEYKINFKNDINALLCDSHHQNLTTFNVDDLFSMFMDNSCKISGLSGLDEYIASFNMYDNYFDHGFKSAFCHSLTEEGICWSFNMMMQAKLFNRDNKR